MSAEPTAHHARVSTRRNSFLLWILWQVFPGASRNCAVQQVFDGRVFVGYGDDHFFFASRRISAQGPHMSADDFFRFLIQLRVQLPRDRNGVLRMLLTAFPVVFVFLITSQNAEIVTQCSLNDASRISLDTKPFQCVAEPQAGCGYPQRVFSDGCSYVMLLPQRILKML